MQLTPEFKRLLEKLGVNVTRLEWRLHEREKRKQEGRKPSLPPGLQWTSYKHKFCPNCNALLDGSDERCGRCGASVPSARVYKVMRAAGLARSESSAPVVSAFLAVMAALYVLSILSQGPSAILLPSDETLMRFGLLYPFALNETGEYWRFLGFGLFHFGLIHIGFNATALMQIGPFIEQQIGPKRMLVLITVGQLGSAYAAFGWTSGAVGASGWLFGLLGFGVTYFHRVGPRGYDIRNQIFQWLVYALVAGYLMRVNTAAHVGGMIGGLVLGWIADLTPARRTIWTALWETLAWPSLFLWIATLVFMARSILDR